MIQEAACVFLVTTLTIFAYIKLRYPFWNLQPVYHKYDLWNLFCSEPYSPYKYRPVKTKFCDEQHIKTMSYVDCSREQKQQLVDLLQCFYIPTDRILHTILKKDLDVYLNGANEPAYISFYIEDEYLPIGNLSEETIRLITKPIGCITSRPFQLLIRPTLREPIYTKLSVYFIDYLCVDRDHETKSLEINRKLLQTHEYNQRTKNPSIAISIIKSETNLFDGVVPLFRYNVATFALRDMNVQPMPPHFQVVRIYKENMDVLTDFLHMQANLMNVFPFDLCVLPELGTIVAAIRKQLLYAFCIQRENIVYSIYFIKNARLRYEDVDGNTLHCIGSVMNYQMSPEDIGKLFFLGLLHSLKDILREKPSFKMILFDDMGHNRTLLRFWRERNTELILNNAAYYAFNWVVPHSSFSAERCFVLQI